VAQFFFTALLASGAEQKLHRGPLDGFVATAIDEVDHDRHGCGEQEPKQGWGEEMHDLSTKS
jgi:hypothetical protein